MNHSLSFPKLVIAIFGAGITIMSFAAGLGLVDDGQGLFAFITFMSAALLAHWTVVAYVAARDYEEEAERRVRISKSYVTLLRERIQKGHFDDVETR